jgi:pilus assembly protein Flp/PilA
MSLLPDRFFAFRRDEQGATAIEYALVAGLMSVAIVPAAALIGPRLSTMFTGLLAAFN